MEKKQVFIKVYGKVQGVGFRYTVKNYANSIGLKGFVKNCYDNTVEIEAIGNEGQIRELLRWIRTSPGHSRVDRASETGFNGDRNYSTFYIA